jgi:hypothetical protein
MSVEQDVRLSKNGVFFLPWIGEKYGDGFRERKLLILGESHYDTWNGQRHILEGTFTRECVQEVLDRERGAPLWPYVEQALLNEERSSGWAPSGGLILWRQIAFYNFVQSPVRGGAQQSPTEQQFADSKRPFRAAIEELRPDRVLVCGYRLWNHMEETPHELNLHNRTYLHDDIQGYCLTDGSPIWCLAMKHPSIAFSWRRWHPIITAFLKDPADAAPLHPHR